MINWLACEWWCFQMRLIIMSMPIFRLSGIEYHSNINVVALRRSCHRRDNHLTWKRRHETLTSITLTILYDPEKMYCLQWLIPVLLIPKPVNPALLQTHVMFMALYLIGFFLERKPCTICSLVFLAAVFLICYSGIGNCLLWSTNCDTVRCDNG